MNFQLFWLLYEIPKKAFTSIHPPDFFLVATFLISLSTRLFLQQINKKVGKRLVLLQSRNRSKTSLVFVQTYLTFKILAFVLCGWIIYFFMLEPFNDLFYLIQSLIISVHNNWFIQYMNKFTLPLSSFPTWDPLFTSCYPIILSFQYFTSSPKCSSKHALSMVRCSMIHGFFQNWNWRD